MSDSAIGSHPPGGCLSRSARRLLLDLGVAAMPAGERFPAPTAAAIDRLDRFLARQPRSWQLGLELAARTLQHLARLRYGRGFTALSAQRRLDYLELLHRGAYPGRMLLRYLLGVVKIAHYDNPALFAEIGCVHRVPPVEEGAPPRYMQRVVDARSLAGGAAEVEAEVVIVGSGAGGAVLAAELAELGVAVVLVEEGAYYRRKDFTGRPPEMLARLYRDGAVTATLGNTMIPLPFGRCVGGTTTINSGTCYRVPERVLRRWRTELGLEGFTAEQLEPHYAKVEQILQTTPADPRLLGGIAEVIATGCAALGYTRHGPLVRNAPDCDGSSFCAFGCPTDAKRSTNVSYVPLALRYGAQLFTNARVTEILVASGRAAGVRTSGALTVRARAVVLAAGAVMTPALLLRNRLANSSGQVGRNLSIHPAMGVMGVFPTAINGYRSIPQGYCIEELHHEGLLFEGGFMPLDATAGSVCLFGRRFTEVMESFERVGYFGFMIEDTSRGRVLLPPGGRPLITYFMNRHDVSRLKRGVEVLCRIFMAAGAEAVFPMVAGFDEIHDARDLERLRRTRLYARDFDLTAYHPLGTSRMGIDPRSSVVGPSHEAHDLEGLFVCDGSSVPSSLGVNPQLMIMAMATRAARYVARAVEG